VQFQGILVLESGKRIIDRTTLTLQPAGTVRQLMETSNDDGRTWTVAYDAIYRRSENR
jgi:YD repeat-containing protein